ncbi:MAG: hypothetical protein ACKE5M_05635 [Methylophilaceae bacterium]
MTIETTSGLSKGAIGKGTMLAMGAAALILAGCGTGESNTASTAELVHCAGLNACKGTSDCKTAENACKGQNECKGHGFLAMTEADCTAKGGEII